MSYRRFLVVPALVLGVGGIAACDDDGGGGSLDEAYCQARIDLEVAILAEPPDQAGINAGLTGLEDNAPSDLEEPTTVFVDAFRTDPRAAFDDPEVVEAGIQVSEAVYDDCGFEQVEVTGLDFSFDGIPEEIDAGDVAFKFTNDGVEPHEMAIARINDDADMTIDEILQLPRREGEALITEEGGTFAEPGGTDYSITNLEAGNYAMLCFVETDEGVPHVAEGMVYPFEVT
jgi:hypothetical protein